MEKETREEKEKIQIVTEFWNGVREINLVQFDLECIYKKLEDIKNTIYRKIPFDPNHKERSDLTLWNPTNVNVKVDRTMIKDLKLKE